MNDQQTYQVDFRKAAAMSASALLSALGGMPAGLTTEEARQRLAAVGPNALTVQHRHWWQIAGRQFASPFIYLLFGAAVVSLVLGETTDAIFIFAFVAINATIGFVQEYRSERSISALKKFVVRHTHVRRGGETRLVETTAVVPGDVLVLEAGDTIPADVRFTKMENVEVDESVLTGESVAARKQVDPVRGAVADLFAATTIGFSGTTVTAGSAEGMVIATGRRAYVGTLERTAVETKKETAFEQGMNQLSLFILKLMSVTLAVVILFHIVFNREGLPVGDLFVFAVALAVGVVPEALPLVITLSLARGAVRLAHRKVVPKRLSAIEDLGAIDVLATDKTGTITENKLTVVDVFGERAVVLESAARSAAFFGERVKQPNNAFDLAVWEQLSATEQKKVSSGRRYHDIPFDPHRRRNAVVVDIAGKPMLLSRGAPEDIFSLLVRSDPQAAAWVEQQGGKGYRVIAVASRRLTRVPDQWDTALEKGAVLVGCIAFEDPLKETTSRTIKRARELGVAIKILTGDSPGVAGTVGRAIGLVSRPEDVVTGSQFAAAPSTEKHALVESRNVFARMTPDLKLEVVRLLEERHIVGFLGEGFNDAPALKVAQVALSVQGASDIAQDASDIILLNKSLDVIIEGIREGRRTLANTMKYIKSTLASNLGNFFALAASSLFVPFLPMLPVQILLVNLLTDSPLVSIATDRVANPEVARPEPWKLRDIILVSIVLGIVSSAFDFLFFGYFVRYGETTLQTFWFLGSVLTELALIFGIRTRGPFWRTNRPSWPLIGLSVAATAVTLGVIFIPGVRQFFHFGPPAASYLAVALSFVVLYFVSTELVKLWYYRTLGAEQPHTRR